MLTALDDERVLVRATVENTAELRWWLLGFGELVEVLAPAALREEFRERATAMAALYQQPSRSPATRQRSHARDNRSAAAGLPFTVTVGGRLSATAGQSGARLRRVRKPAAEPVKGGRG